MIRTFLLLLCLILGSCTTSEPVAPVGCGTMPPGAAEYSLRMVSLYPNPVGDDDYNEKVTVKNFGGSSVSPVGWKLRDRENVTWDLGSLGSLDKCQEKVYTSDKVAQLLNSGDQISLVAPDGTVVQTVSFGTVKDGEEIKP